MDDVERWERRGVIAAPAEMRSAWRASGWWGDHCLLDWWSLAVAARPDAPAVVDRAGTAYTYAQADAVSSRIASWLTDRGTGPGDIVPVQLPNWSPFLPVLIAVMKTGATITPLSPNLRHSEWANALDLCAPRVAVMPTRFRRTVHSALARELLGEDNALESVLLVGPREHDGPEAGLPHIEDVVRTSPPLARRAWARSRGDDIAAVLFTSGSEAAPKGVMLSHNNVIASENAFAYGLRLGAEDSIFMPSPLGHATGFLHGVVMPILTRGASILCDSTDGAEMSRMLVGHGATCGMSVPAVVDTILCSCQEHSADLARLRFLCCGGAPVPRRLLERARGLGVRLYSVYGSTEHAPHTMTTSQDPDERVLSTDGCACAGAEVRIVDPVTRTVLPAGAEGEEASRGPAVFSGYLGRPDLTGKVLDDEGWYYSGDLAVMDAEGYIRISGRRKDLIIRGGENISPSEVEGVLMGHPAIAAATVVPVPDPVLGERALACIARRPGAPKIDVPALREWFIDQGVAKFKIPEYVEHLEEMPLTSAGKVDRVALRRRARSFQPPAPSCR